MKAILKLLEKTKASIWVGVHQGNFGTVVYLGFSQEEVIRKFLKENDINGENIQGLLYQYFEENPSEDLVILETTF